VSERRPKPFLRLMLIAWGLAFVAAAATLIL
jgi:hypothetical protein